MLKKYTKSRFKQLFVGMNPTDNKRLKDCKNFRLKMKVLSTKNKKYRKGLNSVFNNK